MGEPERERPPSAVPVVEARRVVRGRRARQRWVPVAVVSPVPPRRFGVGRALVDLMSIAVVGGLVVVLLDELRDVTGRGHIGWSALAVTGIGLAGLILARLSRVLALLVGLAALTLCARGLG